MAWLELHPTSGRFKICFRWGGRKFKKTVKTADRMQAQSALARFNENLSLLERGRLDLPPGADIGAFLLSDGKLSGKPIDKRPPKVLTLGKLRDLYLAAHSNGAMEANSLYTVQIHFRHVIATLGINFPVESLTHADLQKHIDRRAKKSYRGRPLSAVTLRKDLVTLRACWNWGCHAVKLSGVFPARGLSYPKTDEKPPFQTRAEIEQQVGRGGLSEVEVRQLWECLFLTRSEIEELLTYIRDRPTQPFLFPMVCMAAHTGARRSELLRVKINDIDFTSGTILLHEKKRVRGRRTNRRVAMSTFLQDILRRWLAIHPGGQFLFEQVGDSGDDGSSKSQVGITRNEAHDHFRRALQASQWAMVRGWHVLRHSFASNCAAAGLDQRLINEWMGHQTDEMVRRYRHLFPDQQRQAIATVFG